MSMAVVITKPKNLVMNRKIAGLGYFGHLRIFLTLEYSCHLCSTPFSGFANFNNIKLS